MQSSSFTFQLFLLLFWKVVRKKPMWCLTPVVVRLTISLVPGHCPQPPADLWPEGGSRMFVCWWGEVAHSHLFFETRLKHVEIWPSVCVSAVCLAGGLLSSSFRCSVLLMFPSMLGSRGRSYLILLTLSVLYAGKQTPVQRVHTAHSVAVTVSAVIFFVESYQKHSRVQWVQSFMNLQESAHIWLFNWKNKNNELRRRWREDPLLSSVPVKAQMSKLSSVCSPRSCVWSESLKPNHWCVI